MKKKKTYFERSFVEKMEWLKKERNDREEVKKIFDHVKKEFPNFEFFIKKYYSEWKIDYIKWIDNPTFKLTENQVVFLRDLNNQLVEIEKILKKEVTKLIEIGDSRVADSNDWINDYEIESSLTFYLNKNDPDYSDDDNILIQLSYLCSKHQRWDFGIGDGENHNEFSSYSGNHPLKNEYLCYLFHMLTDTDIGWSNILRIGFIWLDVDIEFQRFIDFSKVNSLRK